VGNAEIERSLIVLFGAVGLILLIACANVASLTVARSLQRGREIAIRSALGASRSRLVRQLLTEQLVLAGGGCVLAAWIAATLVPLLLTRIPDSYFDQSPALREASVDLVALGFAAAIAAVTAVTFGLAPALLASRGSALDVLRSDSRVGTSRAHHRVRDAIVTAEIGMTFVILVAAVLMGRSLVALSRVDAGFAPDRVATARVSLSGPAYADGHRQQRFFEEVLARLRVLPGVEAVAAVSQPPLSGGGSNAYRVDGEPLPDPGQRPEARMRAVAGEYFRTLRIPIVAGRPLTARDDTVSAYALVINQSLARKLFGSQSALGRRLRIYGWQDSAWTIVGVARDVRIARLDQPAPPTIYYSHLQGPANRMTVLARVPADVQALETLRRTINAVDPNAAIYGAVTMSELVARSPAVSSRRSLLVVFGAFAATALVLALVGVYGVLAYAVTQRSRELAIRTALGATVSDVVALVARDAVRLAVAGLALGTVAALVVTRALAALLFGITPGDVTTYAIVALLVGVVCAMASWVPARRACRVDPALTLRAE
jgi:predicted permease